MITIKKIAVIVTLSIVQQCAYAITYYIDSELGNDSWSGKRPAAAASPSTDGPWQSLNRLAIAALSPGDVVELQCGSKWIQTLQLKSSGTPDLPITIRPTSSTCGIPPSIDGSQRMDAYGWVRHNNAIYKASWPIQKFQNGSIAAGVEGWTSWSASADQKLVYESSCPDSSSGCASFMSSTKKGDSVAISNDFLIESGVSYNGELSLRIPAGIRIKVLVRRGSSPYDAISAVQWITGTNAWQKIGFAFVSRNTISNARLDIEVPAGVKFYFRNASLKPVFATPIGAWMGDLPLLSAYHPNRGHDASHPNSVYAKVVADSDAMPLSNGGAGSTYLDIDSTLKLPQGVTPRPGNRLRIRTAGWHIDEAIITQIVGTRLFFEPTTRYQIRAGQGYYLLDQLGMLDSPGEWFYDENTAATYVWAPDGNAPSDQIRLSILEKGIDLSKRSNIIIEGIDILHTGLGVDLTKAQNITLRSMHVANTIREGILATSAKNIILSQIVSGRPAATPFRPYTRRQSAWKLMTFIRVPFLLLATAFGAFPLALMPRFIPAHSLIS
ncbi:MAG: carbohydrate binding domain-containing protein [Nitrosospira sp.]